MNRRSTVSLHGNWGEVRLGRDYTPQFWNTLYSDPFGNVGIGTSLAATLTVLGSASTRSSNSFGYFLPSGLGGLYGQVQHFLGENPSNLPDDGTGTGIRLGYAASPLDVAASHMTVKFAAGDQRTSSLYATYDFKVAQVWAHARWDRIGGAAPDGKGQIVSAVVPLAPHAIKASLSRYRVDSPAAPTSTKLALGYMYNLSKRAALYTTVAHVRNRNGASLAIGGATTAPNASSTGYEFGVRHTF